MDDVLLCLVGGHGINGSQRRLLDVRMKTNGMRAGLVLCAALSFGASGVAVAAPAVPPTKTTEAPRESGSETPTPGSEGTDPSGEQEPGDDKSKDALAAITDNGPVNLETLGYKPYKGGSVEDQGQVAKIRDLYTSLWNKDVQSVVGQAQNGDKGTEEQVAGAKKFLEELEKESDIYRNATKTLTATDKEQRSGAIAMQRNAVAAWLSYHSADDELHKKEAKNQGIGYSKSGDTGTGDFRTEWNGDGAINDNPPAIAAKAFARMLSDDGHKRFGDGAESWSDINKTTYQIYLESDTGTADRNSNRAESDGRTIDDLKKLSDTNGGKKTMLNALDYDYQWGDNNNKSFSDSSFSAYLQQASWMIAAGFDPKVYAESPENAVGGFSAADDFYSKEIAPRVETAGEDKSFVSKRVAFENNSYVLNSASKELSAKIEEQVKAEDASKDAVATLESYPKAMNKIVEILNDRDGDWSDVGLDNPNKGKSDDDDDKGGSSETTEPEDSAEETTSAAVTTEPEDDGEESASASAEPTEDEGRGSSEAADSSGEAEPSGGKSDATDYLSVTGDGTGGDRSAASKFFVKGATLTAKNDAEWDLTQVLPKESTGKVLRASAGDKITVVGFLATSLSQDALKIESSSVDSLDDGAHIMIVKYNDETYAIEVNDLVTDHIEDYFGDGA